MAGPACVYNQTIAISPKSGTDEYGQTVLGTQIQVLAFHIYKVTDIRTENGERRVANHRISTVVPIELNDLVWLPGTNFANPEEALTPQLIKRMTDPICGDFHQVTFL